MPYVDREGTPEHTTHHESCGCSEAREARLREEIARLRAALRPFAEGMASYGSRSNEVGYDHYISVECRESDVRRAAAALKEPPHV